MNAGSTDKRDRPTRDELQVVDDLRIASDVRNIERVVGQIMRLCEELDLPRQKCALNVPVALSEALSNAILRGNHENPEKQVRVRASVNDEVLVLEVADEGDGFDMQTAMRDPTAPENLLREDGRGLFLMHRLMDRVEQSTEGSNVVRLILRR
jgi:serine/threonine-protein kinase RsbW